MKPVAALLAALALGVSACGSDEEDAPERAQTSVEEGAPSVEEATTSPETVAQSGERPLDRDPCKLLSRDQVAAVFGEKVKGRYEKGDDANVCGYRSGAPADRDADPPVPSGIDVFLGVEYFVGISRELATQGGPDPPRDVPGVGDSAYVAGNNAGAVVGDAGIMVTVLGLNPSEPEVEDLLIDLLEKAVAGY